MRMFVKRKPTSVEGPRKNHWKGPRAGQERNPQGGARRGKTVGRWIRVMKWGGLVTGMVLLGWVIMREATRAGPALIHLFEITTVTVEGVRHLEKQEVINHIGLKSGTALHHIVTATIKEQVESLPWVKEAEVTRVPFHELRISVIERKPAAVVRTDSENFLSDESGHVLARLGQTDDDTLPMVTGVDPDGLRRGDREVRQTIASSIELAKLVGYTYEGRLQVNAENPSNLVASVRGVQFHFREDALSDQWQRFQRVKPTLKTLSFDGHGGGANEVDLRYENRIIVRERG